VQVSRAPLSNEPRAAGTSRARKGGSITAIAIRNSDDCVAMQSNGA
jgi:hypothetical protein